MFRCASLHRITRCDCAILGNLEAHRRRKLRLELRHQSLDSRYRVNDVRIRLTIDLDLNHRIAVHDAEIANIFVAVDHAPKVRKADRRAVAIYNDQVFIFLRQKELVGRIDRNLALGVFECALGLFALAPCRNVPI